MTTFQAFNLPQFIPINRHPGLQEYLETLIDDIMNRLHHIYRVNLCILIPESRICIEKYTLDFGEFQHVDEVGSLQEVEVYDEFRSSLNSAIKYVEQLAPVRNNSVTFEVVINAVELSLGHPKGVYRERDDEQENGTEDWVKCEENENFNLAEQTNGEFLNKIKMTALVGCDIGPLVIHHFSQRLITNNTDMLQKIYVGDPESYSSFNE